jgi:hypothetical protein
MENYRLIRTPGRGAWITFRQLLIGAGLVCAGLLAGSGTYPSSRAWGEVQIAPPPKSFETGGQQSVPILKEMAATLHQMDARLAHMEAVARLLQDELQLGKHAP